MHGNVWEWCADWYDAGYYAQSPENDPLGPTKSSGRVRRGGSWSFNPVFCRSATRFRRPPGYRADDSGFRVALVPSE